MHTQWETHHARSTYTQGWTYSSWDKSLGVHDEWTYEDRKGLEGNLCSLLMELMSLCDYNMKNQVESANEFPDLEKNGLNQAAKPNKKAGVRGC